MAFSKPKAFERAERFAAKGQHDKAAREYQSIVENDPKDVRAWLMLADCLVRTGDRVGAVERYERVAQYYVEAKEHNKALAVYRQVLALDAQRLDVQLKMAALNLQVGHTQDAIAIYERVGHAQLQLGRVADALHSYKLAADADPSVVARRLRLAELYSREKRNAEAVEAFRAAGRQLRQLGRLSDYVRVAERLLYHDESDLPTVRDLARAYLELGDPRRALLKLNGLLRAHPKDEEGIELLADTFMALGKPEKAISALEELTRALRAKGPPAKADAIRVLRRGLEWRPGHAEFREALTELEGRRRTTTGPEAPVHQPTAGPDTEELDVETVDDGDLVELDDDDVVMEDEPEPESVSLPEAASLAPGTRRTVEVEALPSTEPSLTQSVLSEVEASAELAGAGLRTPGQASELDVGDEGLTDLDKILFEARVYIKYRLFEHALEHVHAALQQQPQHVGALAVQAKALAELGRAEEAAEAHLAIAELMADGDPSLAREQLAAARELAPANPRLDAVARLLGPAPPARVVAIPRRAPIRDADHGDSGAFDVVSEGFDPDLSPAGIALDLADEPRANLVPAEDDVHTTQPFAPVDVARASSSTRQRQPTPAAGFVARPPEGHDTTEVRGSSDGHGPLQPEGRGPRRRLSVGRPPEEPAPEPARTGRTLSPHMPQEPAPRTDPAHASGSGPARTGRTLLGMPTADDDEVASDELDAEPTVPPAAPTRAAAPAVEQPDLSDELEEIQFFVDQGLDDDARFALDDLEARHPGHRQIAEFRYRAFGEGAPPEPSEPAAVEPEPIDDDRSELPSSMLDLDLEPIEPESEAAEPLVSLDDDQPAAEPLVSFDDDEDDEDAYLSAIFADPVKKKPKGRTDESTPGANVAEGQAVDAATAFDLGVAYREMGLVDAAIAQFETAAGDPQWRARALTLLGALRVHRGETDRAIADLKEAVRLASTPAEASEAAYELGVLYGVIGDSEAAIQQLLTVAPGYRDRDERLAELGF